MNDMVYHKDCAYYEHCKITELREAGHNIIILGMSTLVCLRNFVKTFW
jgi:hypothetical protein